MMMQSNLTHWIEDADTRDFLLQGTMIHQFQENAPRQYIHLGRQWRPLPPGGAMASRNICFPAN
jgi:hypothetical protein